jgi:hypothetical protein
MRIIPPLRQPFCGSPCCSPAFSLITTLQTRHPLLAGAKIGLQTPWGIEEPVAAADKDCRLITSSILM